MQLETPPGSVGWDAVRETERRKGGQERNLPCCLSACCRLKSRGHLWSPESRSSDAHFVAFQPNEAWSESVKAGLGRGRVVFLRAGTDREVLTERLRGLVFLLPSWALWAPAICGRSDRFWCRVSQLFPAVIHLKAAAGRFSVSLALPLCLSVCLS